MRFKPSFGSFRDYCFGTVLPAGVPAGVVGLERGAAEVLPAGPAPGAGRTYNPLSVVPVTDVGGSVHSLANEAGIPSRSAMLERDPTFVPAGTSACVAFWLNCSALMYATMAQRSAGVICAE